MVNSYWMVTAVLDASWRVDKVELGARLKERGVDTRPFFYPLSSLPAFASEPEAEVARRRNAVSYKLSPNGINLPTAGCLTREDVTTVCEALKDALGVKGLRRAS